MLTVRAAPTFVNPEPSPTNDAAVIIPVVLTDAVVDKPCDIVAIPALVAKVAIPADVAKVAIPDDVAKVALEALPLKLVAVTTPETDTSPETCNFDVGFVVPIPKAPVLGIKTICVVEIPIEVTPTLFANVGYTWEELNV